MATKKKAVKAKKSVAAPAQFEASDVTETNKLDLRAPSRRGSMYDTVYAKMEKLKEGQSFTVPVPKGVSVRTLQNRMNAAIRRGPVEAPAGCVFRKYTTADGKIAISCMRNDDAEKKDNRFRVREEKIAKKKAAKKAVKTKMRKAPVAAVPTDTAGPTV